MSKSENQYATIYLSDNDELIRKKVMKAKMDAGPTKINSPKSKEVENMFLLMKLVSAPDTVKNLRRIITIATIRYGDIKGNWERTW